LFKHLAKVANPETDCLWSDSNEVCDRPLCNSPLCCKVDGCPSDARRVTPWRWAVVGFMKNSFCVRLNTAVKLAVSTEPSDIRCWVTDRELLLKLCLIQPSVLLDSRGVAVTGFSHSVSRKWLL
jgi:hypothetical protein